MIDTPAPPSRRRVYSATPAQGGIIRRWFTRDPQYKGAAALTDTMAWPPLRVAKGVPIVLDLGELDDVVVPVAFACEIEGEDGTPFRLVFDLRGWQ